MDHRFLRVHGETGKCRVFQALGLDILRHALLHIAPGQLFHIAADPLHGGSHHLIVTHGGQAVHLFLQGLLLFRLFRLPLSLPFGFGGLMLGTSLFLVSVRIGGIGLGRLRLTLIGIVLLIGFFCGRLSLVRLFQLFRGLIQISVVLKSRLRRRLCGRRYGLTVSRRHRQLVKVLPVLKSALAGERGGRRFAAFLHIQRHFRKISHNKLLSVDKNGMDQDKTCSMPSFTCVTAHRVVC